METYDGQAEEHAPSERRSQITHSNSLKEQEQTQNRDHTSADSEQPGQKKQGLLAKWKKVSFPNKLTVGCSVAIAFATALYTSFALGQWRTMAAQLEQMRGSSLQTNRLITETHNLAENAGTQAANAKALAIAASAQVEKLGAMVEAANKQAVAATIGANAAKAAVETNLKQLELAERPWISADFAIAGPLKFGSDGARVNIRIFLKNTGHSPAIHGMYDFRFLVPFLERPDPARERDDLCKEVEGRTELPRNRRFTQTWFPGDQNLVNVSLPIAQADIRKALVDTPRSLFPDQPPTTATIGPVLVGCIAYRPSFAEVTYSTGYVLDLMQIDPTSGVVLRIEPKPGEIPANALRLSGHFGTGVFAK